MAVVPHYVRLFESLRLSSSMWRYAPFICGCKYPLFRPEGGCPKGFAYLPVSVACGITRTAIIVAERLRLETLRPSD